MDELTNEELEARPEELLGVMGRDCVAVLLLGEITITEDELLDEVATSEEELLDDATRDELLTDWLA